MEEVEYYLSVTATITTVAIVTATKQAITTKPMATPLSMSSKVLPTNIPSY